MKKPFLAGVLATYLFVAVIGGFAMKAVIPALNPLGTAYVGLTWPIAMTCVALHEPCSAIPPSQYSRWMFTFEE